MKNTAKKTLALLLSLVLMLGLLPGMSLTAYADNTCTVTFKANGRTVSKEVTLPHTFSCNYSSENGEFDLIIKELYQLDGGCCGLNPPTVSGSTNVTGGISGDNQYVTVNAPFEGTATFDSVYFDSSKGYMDFEIHLEISCTGAVAAYSVTITPGSNMTKTAGSGEAEQTGLTGAMIDVVYTANDGYYFREFTNITDNGITATRTNETTVTVSGTPTANASITIPDAVLAHTHSFTYSAEGDTITATCGNDGCDLTDNKVTLKIVPTTNLYASDGTSKEASLEGLEAYNAATGMNLSTSNIAYYKSGNSVSSSRIKNGTISTGTYEARIAYNGTDNFGNKVAKVSFTVTLKPTPHTHSFSYAANGNVITATCTQNAANMEACDLANNQATLTLNAPEHKTYGDNLSAEATFTGSIPGVTNPTIHYSKGSVTLSAAPTDAGTYTAWCQLGNATARVEYTIDKADAAYTTEPQAKTLHYTGQPQELVTAGTTSTGQIAYTVGTDPENEPDVEAGGMPYSYSVPKMTNPGTYYVWYKIDGGKNYNDIPAKKVPVTIGDPEASINFLGGSLRRRGYVATGVVVDFETDLRFGFSFDLPEGAEVDTDKSYFRWKLNDSATADAGNKIVMKNVALENGKHVSNMVITGVPKAFYQADINCFVHLVYTVDDMEFVVEANEDSNGEAYTRSVEQVCKRLLDNSQWGAYAQSLLKAIS